jgi:hypothetical protein
VPGVRGEGKMKTITIEMTERQYNMAVYYAKKYYPQYKSLTPIIKLAMAEKVRAMAKREGR